jgi:hypothetical protein
MNLRMNETAFERAGYYVTEMYNSMGQEEYNDHLFKLVNIILHEKIIADLASLSFFEFFELTYNCLHVILQQAEIREKYELCHLIQGVIINEDKTMVEYINSLPENERDEMFDEFYYLKIAMITIRQNNITQ